MKTINNILEKILFHPVNARIAYDFTATFLLSGFYWLVFIYSHQAIFSLILIFFFPILLVSVAYLLGIYSYQKLAKVRIKALLLFLSVFVSGVLVFRYSTTTPEVFTLLSMLSIMLVLPRIFLSVHQYTPKSHDLLKNTIDAIQIDKKPILVAGGAGYIGSHLVEQLLQSGKRVRVFDKFLFGKESLEKFSKNKNLELIEGDVSNIFELTQAVKDCSAIVHLSGIVGDPACSIDPALTRHNNTVSTRMLIDAALAFKVPRFIFASSCSVYGLSDKIVNEASDLNPVSLYAQTKIDSEQELLRHTHDNFHPTILRFATVFGHSNRMRFDLVGNLFTAQAFESGNLTVTGDDQWRPFIHVSDIAKAIALVLDAPIQQVSLQIFNVGSDHLNETIGGLAKRVVKIVKTKNGKKAKISIIKNQDDKRNYSVSFAKIKKVLGFVPTVSFEIGIKETYQFFKQGVYKYHYTNEIYSNLLTTKLLKTEFDSKEYRATHYSIMGE